MHPKNENQPHAVSAIVRRVRAGLTLAELLIVIAIILVLSTLALAVMQSAQEDALESATRSRTEIIERMMQSVLEDFEVRRLPISNGEILAYAQENPIFTQDAIRVQARNLRRRILLDMLRAEYPSWSIDANGNFVANVNLGNFPTTGQPFSLVPIEPAEASIPFLDWLEARYPNVPPGYSLTLAERLEQLKSGEILFWESMRAESRLNEPGEYLYQIVRRINIDGSSGLEMLGDSAVGDPDADGLPDIVDAWGNSMRFRVLQEEPDSMQVAPGQVQTDPDRGVWVFGDTDWSRQDPATLLPEGYQVLNSIVPSPLSSVRFHVVSPVLESQGN